jgi:hypothetical protein
VLDVQLLDQNIARSVATGKHIWKGSGGGKLGEQDIYNKHVAVST